MPVSPRVVLEICVGTVADAVVAAENGADRIELCSALELGGLTPSLGALIEARRTVSIPIVAMVRPRAGGFCYSPSDFAAMVRDAELALAHGANGIVFGCLLADGRVDLERSAQLVALARGRDAVFHRAFDAVPDPRQALEELIRIGVTRVLTSGQESTALLGARQLANMVHIAGDRIEILPGGGIGPHNVLQLLQQTGCTQVHMGLARQESDRSSDAGPRLVSDLAQAKPGDFRAVDGKLVRDAARTLRMPGGSTQ